MGDMKMTILFTLALGVSVASADKLADFKDAVAKSGCEGIPYSDYRSSCLSQQSQIHDWCDGARGPVTCGSEYVTRQVKDNLEKERRTVQELREKRDKLQDSKSRASTEDEKNKISKEIEQVEKDVYEGDKRVEQAQKDLRSKRRKSFDPRRHVTGEAGTNRSSSTRKRMMSPRYERKAPDRKRTSE